MVDAALRKPYFAHVLVIAISLLLGLPTFSAESFPEMRSKWDRVPVGEELRKLQAAGQPFVEAEHNSRLAIESLYRCHRYAAGWLAQADPATGLIPENLRQGRDHWNGRNCGADNYPFMVLTCAFTDESLFRGRMREMLTTEAKLTKRVDRLGDVYQFSKRGFEFKDAELDRIVF